MKNAFEKTEINHADDGKINFFVLLMIVLNILIPKAGIKLSGVPLTLGSLSLALILINYFLKLLLGKLHYEKSSVIFMILLSCLYSFFRILIPAVTGNIITSTAVYLLAAMCIYPLTFFVVIFNIKNSAQIERLIKIILSCFFLTMLYALLQFLLGIEKTAIPGITVNYSDYIASPSRWFLNKSNGNSYAGVKIFSTYQNGNIYGMALLTFYPLLSIYFQRNKNFFCRFLLLILFALCAFTTSSRTVWIGTILYTFMMLKPVLRKNKSIILGFLLALLAGRNFIMQEFTGYINRFMYSIEWATFREGAGRTAAIISYFDWLLENGSVFNYLFGSLGMDYPGGAYEMTYFAIFVQQGLIGLALFLLPVFCIMSLIRKDLHEDWIIDGIYRGLILYFVCAFIEGAYWLPPTAINLWAVLALGYKRHKILNRSY